MEEEKKSKRPRIGAPGLGAASSENGGNDARYEKVNYPLENRGQGDENQDRDQQQRPYQPRNNYGYGQPRQQGYNRQGGYQQRQGGYNRQGGYQQRPSYGQGGYQQRQGGYQPRQNQGEGYQPRQNREGYQPRQNQGEGYQPRQNQGEGYQPRQNQGEGYQPRQNQGEGGYQPRQHQNGYQPRQHQNGYQQNRQGGYQQRQGGYQQNRQGGYQQRPGGYQQRPAQGGYNRQQNRQGGYQQNRQGGYRQQNNRNNQGMRFMPRPKQIDYVLEDIDPNEQVRLNKFMANSGICSRREADEFITAGKVKVNGVVVTELGTKISRNDVVEFDEKVVTPERKCYVLLNKPKDCVTTSDDPNGRTTVLDLVKNACRERIYPVGRLDRNTTGVLLLTNDGDLASKLTHPKFVKKKIYHVWTDKDITEEDMQRIADGIELEDGEIHADAISYVSETDRNQAGIEIHSGRNRIVRRIFESLGYRVTKLDRVYFAGLTKKNLPRGRWRYLTQEEVNYLRMGAFE